MTAAPQTRLMTADELAERPDDGKLYELVRGELIEVSPASIWSSYVAANLIAVIGEYVKQRKLGLVTGADGGLWIERAPDTVRAPDVAFVRRDRLPKPFPRRSFFPGAPDLAAEVLSPTDRYAAVLRKVGEYLAAGTRLVWVVDPEKRLATVFHPERAPITVAESGALDGEDVLPGLSIPLADLWPDFDADE